MTVASLAVVHAVSGDGARARLLLGRLKEASAQRHVSPVLPAFVHVALGQMDSAFALLEEAYAARDSVLIPIQAGEIGGVLCLPEERMAALRSDPRLSDLLRRMGFVPRASGPAPR